MTTHPLPRRPSATRNALAALLAAVVLAPTVGCGVFGGGTSVLLVGDSLTVLVSDDLKAAAGSDYEIKVDAEWGVRIDEEIDAAAESASSTPDHVIVNLGTNNVLQGHDTTASAADLASLLDVFDGAKCFHIVNINEHIVRAGVDYSAGAKALNEQVATLAARRLDTRVIDWNQIVADHLDDGIISDDGVHPTAAGVKLLNSAYLDALKSC